MQVTSEGLQEVYSCGEATETILIHESPKQAKKANRLFSLRCCLGDSLWYCLEDSLEPFRLDAAKDLTPEEQIPDSPNGFGRFGIVDNLLENVVARRQGAAHDLQHAAIVQLLQYFVCSQYSFSMLFRSVLQSGPKLSPWVARRNF